MKLYAEPYMRAAGVPLVTGSLNLVLDEDWSLPDHRITLTADEVGRLVHLVPCRVHGHQCFIFRTQLAEETGGDAHRILELLSSIRLRDELGLADGDIVEVVIEDLPTVGPTAVSGAS
jgi:CTP-dependent riboflavin kinase